MFRTELGELRLNMWYVDNGVVYNPFSKHPWTSFCSRYQISASLSFSSLLLVALNRDDAAANGNSLCSGGDDWETATQSVTLATGVTPTECVTGERSDGDGGWRIMKWRLGEGLEVGLLRVSRLRLVRTIRLSLVWCTTRDVRRLIGVKLKAGKTFRSDWS
jgi:hypothetical protein